MYDSSNFSPVVVAIASFVALSACSGASVPSGGFPDTVEHFSTTERLAPSPLSGAVGRYSHSGPLLFVPNVGPDTVQVYPAKANNPSPIATITDGIDYPEDACIDANGNLYVTNLPVSGSGWISVYAAGQTKPSEVITDGINGPASCAIDAKGNLWVTNLNGANATEYLKGAKGPHEIITSGLISPNGIAIDHSGNLYVADGPSQSIEDNIQVYSPKSKSPTRTITDGVTSPVGITVDGSGTLYVTNEFQNNVEEYRAGKSRPYQAITQAMDGPSGVTVDRDGRLYVSNWENAVVTEFARGSTTPSKREIAKDLYTPSGPAYSPPLLP